MGYKERTHCPICGEHIGLHATSCPRCHARAATEAAMATKGHAALDSAFCGPVTPEEALQIAQRFIDKAFGNTSKPMPRFSIPVSPQDDDVRLIAYIHQSATPPKG